MAARQVRFRAEAREKVLRGATALADAVRITLGPKSRCVLIGRSWGYPLVCDDGVTIAREFELADPEEDLGVKMLKQAAVKPNDEVGDGTTTATLLAHAMFAEGLRNVAAGASAIDLRRGLERGRDAAVQAIAAQARKVASRRDNEQVATISAHGDTAVGRLVADAMEKVGVDGIITVEEAKGTETSLEVVEGMRFDRGYLSPYFVTDPERMECVLEEPLLLVHEKKIAGMKELLPLLEQAVQQARPLVVVAEDVEADALATLVVNKLRGALRVVAVKAPGFGERQKAMLEDLGVLTGGQVLSADRGDTLEHTELSALGAAARVVVTHDHTTVVGGKGERKAIAGRVAQLRRQIEETTSDYDKEKLQERLARLVGGVAVIRVGAPTEADLKARKEAYDDAIHATQAAVAEGVVPGAGLALLRAAAALEAEEAGLDGDQRTGLRILRRALEAPTRQIAENSGADPGVVVDRMRGQSGMVGFDAARGVYVDLLEAGVIDPAKVVRVALQNAVSVAGTLLLTEATMTEVPEPKKARAEHAGLEE